MLRAFWSDDCTCPDSPICPLLALQWKFRTGHDFVESFSGEFLGTTTKASLPVGPPREGKWHWADMPQDWRGVFVVSGLRTCRHLPLFVLLSSFDWITKTDNLKYLRIPRSDCSIGQQSSQLLYNLLFVFSFPLLRKILSKKKNYWHSGLCTHSCVPCGLCCKYVSLPQSFFIFINPRWTTMYSLWPTPRRVCVILI